MAIADLILWVDLETTGGKESHDDIIEIGAVLTDRDFNAIDTYKKVYRSRLAVADLTPVVAAMHTFNGLWDEVQTAQRFANDDEQAILDWLRRYVSPGDVVPLGGSGVAHFDRRFINKTWPRLANRLTYWSFDIGPVRRFARIAGLNPPIPQEDKSHRALADVAMHIEEARWFVSAMALAAGIHPGLG